MGGFDVAVVIALSSLAGFLGTVAAAARLKGVISRRWRARRLRVMLEKQQVQPVAELQEGPGVVEGRAVMVEPLPAPTTDEEVIAFCLELKTASRDRPSPEPLVSQEGLCPFEVVDDTGRVLVSATDFELRLETIRRKLVVGEDEVPPRVAALLAEHGHPVEAIPDATALYWNEGRLQEDEPVFVFGHARREVDPTGQGGGYRDAATRLVVGNLEGMPVVIADSSRADFLASVKKPLDDPDG